MVNYKNNWCLGIKNGFCINGNSEWFFMFYSSSKGLAEISLGETLNLVNPIPFWKAVDEAGGMAAANGKLLATTGKHYNLAIGKN